MNDQCPEETDATQADEEVSSVTEQTAIHAVDTPSAIEAVEQSGTGLAAHFCTSCGGAVSVRDAFCAHCGHVIGGADLVEATQPGTMPAPAPAAAVVSAAPPPPPAGPSDAAAVGADAKGGRPGWLIPAIAGGAAAVAVVGIGGFLIFGGGGDSSAATRKNAYLARVDRSFTQLTRSATATGNALSTAAAAGDVSRVNQVARRQLQVVSTAYTDLAKVPVTDTDRPAQTALVRAASLHRRYLALLVRATSIPPATGLGQVASVERAGQQTVAGYRDFLRQAPQAAATITAAGLADTAGLKSALKAKRDSQASASNAGGGGTNSGATYAPAGRSGFRSPAGTTVCGAVGGSVVCQARSGTVAIDQSGSAYYSSGGPGGGYGVLQYGQVWSNGTISCAIDRDLGTICNNGSWGFRIRLQDLDINW